MAATPATRKTVNSGRTGPAKSPGTATITAEPAKPNSASATARVERLLAPVVTSSTSSIRRDCGFQGVADAFEFRFEIVKQLGGRATVRRRRRGPGFRRRSVPFEL